jgi:divalent metal cation (Fe/Co/Zn/Cd) transporter
MVTGTGQDGKGSAGSGRDWGLLARRLVAATAAYNTLEMGVALASGLAAGSIALVGFGLDSAIELAAGLATLWRLRVEARGADREALERSETRVRRFVGWTFLALAAYVTGEAAWTLWTADAPDASPVGIGLAILSLLAMPGLALLKMRAARHLHSRALEAEAKETLACAGLSGALLAGLLGNAALGWWWADPVAALAMVPWLVKEGREALSDEGCACHGGGCDHGGA